MQSEVVGNKSYMKIFEVELETRPASSECVVLHSDFCNEPQKSTAGECELTQVIYLLKPSPGIQHLKKSS